MNSHVALVPGADSRSALAVPPLSAELIGVRDTGPAGRARALLAVLLLLAASAVAWMVLARVDIVATAGGKLVPTGYVKIVQPADGGVVEDILVADGARVRAGQVLLRLNATLTQADERSVAAELARQRMELRRIDAESAGLPLAGRVDDDPALLAAAQARHGANRRALADATDQELASLRRARAEVAGAGEQQSKLEQVLPTYREQGAAYRDLQRQGFAGKLMALDKERELIEKERDLAAQGHAIEAGRAQVSQSERRIAQLQSAYRQHLQAERAEAAAQVARLEQEQAKTRHRGAMTELRAPHDGVVKDLAAHARGTVVQPGTVLLSLVPDHEPLQAEVWLKNSDIGFVDVGQAVKLKLAAYPFQKYGLLEGRISLVSADASDGLRAGQGAAGASASPLAGDGAVGGEPTLYRALVTLGQQTLPGPAGSALRLGPGMAVAAEIHQGTRSVLEYLLSPVQRVAQEAARER
jgi:hemolysin D